MNKSRRADRAAGVPRRGRAIHFLERRSPINFSVGDRVHRATAREREIVARMLFMQRLEQSEKRFFVGGLHRAREVLVFLFNRLVRFARRTEEIDQRAPIKCADLGRAIFPSVGNIADVVPKNFQIQSKGPVGAYAHDFAEWIEIIRFAVGRQSHDLVFVAVIWETEKLGKRRIKNA